MSYTNTEIVPARREEKDSHHERLLQFLNPPLLTWLSPLKIYHYSVIYAYIIYLFWLPKLLGSVVIHITWNADTSCRQNNQAIWYFPCYHPWPNSQTRFSIGCPIITLWHSTKSQSNCKIMLSGHHAMGITFLSSNCR